jgi:photosystem II stability/assembly factor-like uncharacterized protein
MRSKETPRTEKISVRFSPPQAEIGDNGASMAPTRTGRAQRPVGPVVTRAAAVAALIVSAVTLVFPARDVQANGRFPSALFLTFGTGERSRSMALATTFGVLTSGDGGKSWRFACEEAVGHRSSLRWDMSLALTSGGALVAGLPDGLSVAAQDHCGFVRPATAPEEPVVDLAVDGSGRRLAAALNVPGAPSGVALSDDGGLTWRMGWASAGLAVLTVDFAPGDSRRLYLSGYVDDVPAILRSDDGGASFTRTAAQFAGALSVYIAAVDANRADTLYLRSEVRPRGTTLLRSDDGGASFQELIRTPNWMTGAAFAPDGRTMWAGSPGGNPGDGVFRSTDRGETWRRMAGGYTTLCLRYHEGVLYMCADGAGDGFAVGCSLDGGETFAPVLTWAEVVGPDGCPAGSSGRTACQAAWPMLRATLVPDGGQRMPSPGCPAAAPDAGAIDFSRGAEAPVADAAVAPSDAGLPADLAGRRGDRAGGGCNCRLGGGGPSSALAVPLVAAAFTARRCGRRGRWRPRGSS